MGDAWGYDGAGTTGEQGNNNDMNGPKALREAYEAMKKQTEELQNNLASVQDELRKQKLSSVFSSLGVPGAENVYQGEPDPEQAKVWVETMRGFFGGNTQGAAPQGTAAQSQPDIDAEKYQRLTEASAEGGALTNFESAATAIGGANNTSDLIAAFQRAQHLG